MKAILYLEDGSVYSGESFGAPVEGTGEVVFNTGMTGYQEILTDPSYKGQIVLMTYPLIGNYGINPIDVESSRVYAEGFIVKELSRITSNWRSTRSLHDYLKENNIPGIEGIDTRAITRTLRDRGSQRGIISCQELSRDEALSRIAMIRDMKGCNLADVVTRSTPEIWSSEGRYHVVVIDCGVKNSILNQLAEQGFRVTVVQSSASYESIKSLVPDAVLISNGPGDPEPVTHVIDLARRLLGTLPLFGICLGHQIITIALGGRTYKLKFGHHGSNHPVKDLRTGRIDITAQNHNFCADMYSLNMNDVEITHINLNDNTVEGLRHRYLPLYSVQFHPEAGPGPHDSRTIFSEFMEIIDNFKRKVS